MPSYEPPQSDYEPEWRLAFQAANPAGMHVVFSGIAKVEAKGENDSPGTTTHITLEVGPLLKSVTAVVPMVSPIAHWMGNADEDDHQRWVISNLLWGFREGLGPATAWGRVTLEFDVHVSGESSWMEGVAYHVTLRTRDASVNLTTPPAHDQVPKFTS